MTMIKKILISVSLLALAFSAFAQYTSNTNVATMGLIEDKTMDKFDTGLEDAKGMIVSDFKPSSYTFNLTFGYWFTENLWAAVQYNANEQFGKHTTKEVNNTAVMTDGITVDYVDTWERTTLSYNTTNIVNNVYTSFYFKDKGFGIRPYAETAFGKYSSSVPVLTPGSSVAAGSSNITDYSDVDNGSETKIHYATEGIVNNSNEIIAGVNFTDLKTKGEKLYFEPLHFRVYLNTANYGGKYNYSSSINDSVVGAGNQISAKARYSYNNIYPAFSGRMVMELPKLGSLSTKFILTDKVDADIYLKKNTSTYTTVSETTGSTVTNVYDYNVKYGTQFGFDNTITPELKFEIEPTEAILLKMRLLADVTYSLSSIKSGITTVDTRKTVNNKINGKTSSSIKHEETLINGNGCSNYQDYLYNGIVFSPYFAAGTSIALKQNKAYLNLGCSLGFSDIYFSTTKYSNNGREAKSTYSETDEDGVVTNSPDVIVKQGNGITESKSRDFTSSRSTGEFSLGFEVFFTDKISLDTTVFTKMSAFGFSNIWNSSSFDLMLKVKF